MEHPMILLETTSGDILLELDPEKAPATVENFLAYVESGFYANTVFHRVIKDFMIQGGGLTMRLEEKPTTRPPVANEAANGLINRRGAVAMARTADPHSATCQFFINTADNPELDHSTPDAEGFGYCVFGHVVEGMDVVDAIQKIKTRAQGGHENVPVDSVLITAASRFEL